MTPYHHHSWAQRAAAYGVLRAVLHRPHGKPHRSPAAHPRGQQHPTRARADGTPVPRISLRGPLWVALLLGGLIAMHVWPRWNNWIGAAFCLIAFFRVVMLFTNAPPFENK